MLRSNRIMTTAALVAASALPGTAAAQQDLRSPDTRDAANGVGAYEPGSVGQDLRSPDAKDAAAHVGVSGSQQPIGAPIQDLRSPDARDAARDLPPVHIPDAIVQVRDVSDGGFDWGDAGIGAAGMLGLFSIAAGTLLAATLRRRRRISVATH